MHLSITMEVAYLRRDRTRSVRANLLIASSQKHLTTETSTANGYREMHSAYSLGLGRRPSLATTSSSSNNNNDNHDHTFVSAQGHVTTTRVLRGLCGTNGMSVLGSMRFDWFCR